MSKQKGLPWDEAILKVLKDNKRAIHYSEIADIIANDGLRPADGIGSTPANTVNAMLHNEKLKDKVACVQRGVYILKEYLNEDPSLVTVSATIDTDNDEGDNDMDDALITAYGRFWSRDMWEKNNMSIYGTSAKTKNAASVDFTNHMGIYLLHKGYEVIYVGQASQLNKRLKDHTIDDKRNRWDNFSWFSITDFNEQEKADCKKDTSKTLEGAALLDTLEALLIEVLGPERNKKVGNEFEDKEFEQLTETEYLRKQHKAK